MVLWFDAASFLLHASSSISSRMLFPPVVLALAISLYALQRRKNLQFNCHFCNRDVGEQLPDPLRVAGSSWYCPLDDCGQYNGFKSDGSYDRELPELSDVHYNRAATPRGFGLKKRVEKHVLCGQCTCHQALKVQTLAAMSDVSPGQIRALEQRYPVCRACEKRVRTRLREVTNMVRRKLMFQSAWEMSNAILKADVEQWHRRRALVQWALRCLAQALLLLLAALTPSSTVRCAEVVLIVLCLLSSSSLLSSAWLALDIGASVAQHQFHRSPLVQLAIAFFRTSALLLRLCQKPRWRAPGKLWRSPKVASPPPSAPLWQAQESVEEMMENFSLEPMQVRLPEPTAAETEAAAPSASRWPLVCVFLCLVVVLHRAPQFSLSSSVDCVCVGVTLLALGAAVRQLYVFRVRSHLLALLAALLLLLRLSLPALPPAYIDAFHLLLDQLAPFATEIALFLIGSVALLRG